jgi:hypothetical protein
MKLSMFINYGKINCTYSLNAGKGQDFRTGFFHVQLPNTYIELCVFLEGRMRPPVRRTTKNQNILARFKVYSKRIRGPDGHFQYEKQMP